MQIVRIDRLGKMAARNCNAIFSSLSCTASGNDGTKRTITLNNQFVASVLLYTIWPFTVPV